MSAHYLTAVQAGVMFPFLGKSQRVNAAVAVRIRLGVSEKERVCSIFRYADVFFILARAGDLLFKTV